MLMGSLPKKIVAFLFLLIVAVPVFLSLKFILEENLILQEVDEKLNTETLQTVQLAKKDIVWVKAGKEILIEDEFFDIKHIEVKNDSFVLTGFFDNEETELMEGFKTYTENNNSTTTPLNKIAFKFLLSPVFNNYHEIVYGTGWSPVSNLYAPFAETLPAAPCLPFTEPPRL